MYPASSSFRAWTLRLPSDMPSSPFSSANDRRSFTARAEMIPNRWRS